LGPEIAIHPERKPATRYALDSPLKLRQSTSGASDASGRVGRVVVEDLVVDLVGHEDEFVPAGQVDDAAQDMVGIDRAGRVVRVDDDDRLGARRDLRREVLQIGRPVGAFVAESSAPGVPPASAVAAVQSG
jgi:hypothetical protein